MVAQPAVPDFNPATLHGVDRAVVGIDGLWCPSCAAAVGRTIEKVVGIRSAQVSFVSASAALSWGPEADLSAVARKVVAMGYRLTAPTPAGDKERHIVAEQQRIAIRLAVAVTFGMWTMLLSILLYINPDGLAEGATGKAIALAAGATALPVIVFAGGPILLAGWRTAWAGVPGMDSLVGLGVAGAVGASALALLTGGVHVWFDTAVMLITLLTLGRLFEMGTLLQATRAIDALGSLLPETAELVIADGNTREVLARDVVIGTQIRVHAGARVPLDGEIVTSASRFDTSVMTGEAAPRIFGVGDAVQAGFVNLQRASEIRVTAPVGARRIDIIGRDIAASLHDRPEVHRLADRLARIIVPLAIGLAAAVLITGLLAGTDAQAAALHALSVLIIACPCAVSLAAPVSHLAATRTAAAHGILFRTHAASETLGAAGTVLFDKTGTLTFGQPVVLDVETQGDSRSLLALASAAEAGITHPVAAAIRLAGGDVLVAETSDRSDNGVVAQIAGQEILLGDASFLAEKGIAVAAGTDTVTAVYMAIDGVWAATLRLGDEIRPDVAKTIGALRRDGIAVGLVSGDAVGPCAEMGQTVGLLPAEINATCTPEDKVARVAAAAGPVVFVGDGINDLAAIVRADVGIAATDASPATIAIADVVIARGGVAAVRRAIVISRRARVIVRQNLVFSVVYNVAGLGLAVFGTVSPLVAASAMAASSLMVIANAARLGTLRQLQD